MSLSEFESWVPNGMKNHGWLSFYSQGKKDSPACYLGGRIPLLASCASVLLSWGKSPCMLCWGKIPLLVAQVKRSPCLLRKWRDFASLLSFCYLCSYVYIMDIVHCQHSFTVKIALFALKRVVSLKIVHFCTHEIYWVFPKVKVCVQCYTKL